MAYEYNPPHEAQHIKLDLFPAVVTNTNLPDTDSEHYLGNGNRVIVTDTHLYVFKDGSEAPDAYILGTHASFSGSTTPGYDVALEDGSVYHVIRAVNCGCGSRLRGFHPFPGVPYAPVTRST